MNDIPQLHYLFLKELTLPHDELSQFIIWRDSVKIFPESKYSRTTYLDYALDSSQFSVLMDKKRSGYVQLKINSVCYLNFFTAHRSRISDPSKKFCVAMYDIDDTFQRFLDDMDAGRKSEEFNDSSPQIKLSRVVYPEDIMEYI